MLTTQDNNRYEFLMTEDVLEVTDTYQLAKNSFDDVFYTGSMNSSVDIESINFTTQCKSCAEVTFKINFKDFDRSSLEFLVEKNYLSNKIIEEKNLAVVSEFAGSNSYLTFLGATAEYVLVRCKHCTTNHLIVLGLTETQPTLYRAQVQGIWKVDGKGLRSNALKQLLKSLENESPKVIFQSICDELGKHYMAKGFKYIKSKQKIVYGNQQLKLEIKFLSNKYNKAGEWVSLEILPGFYSMEISKINKSTGHLFGDISTFYKKNENHNPNLVIVQKIFGEKIERFEENSTESYLIESNKCNVYAIDEKQFDMLVNFIDSKILTVFELLKTKSGIINFLQSASLYRKSMLSGELSKDGQSEFIDYVNFMFPDLDIDTYLK